MFEMPAFLRWKMDAGRNGILCLLQLVNAGRTNFRGCGETGRLCGRKGMRNRRDKRPQQDSKACNPGGKALSASVYCHM
ncbi:MAG: hypothetical protein JWQ21_1978 [Herminiimonas sp.]|nr:hypothetical protein [Herminiimonas sp.]